MELRNGRPEDIDARLPKEQRVYELLASLLMPGDKPFKTSVLSKQIGSSRLSFADGSYMEQFLDITPGSLSVLGLMNDHDHRVKLLIDADVLTGEYIGVHPCINTSSLRIRTADLTEKLIPALGHAPTMVSL